MIWYDYNDRLTVHDNIQSFLFEVLRNITDIMHPKSSNLIYHMDRQYVFLIKHVTLPKMSKHLESRKKEFRKIFTRSILGNETPQICFDFKTHCKRINSIVESLEGFITFEHEHHCEIMYKAIREVLRLINGLINSGYSVKLKKMFDFLEGLSFALASMFLKYNNPRHLRKLRIELILMD